MELNIELIPLQRGDFLLPADTADVADENIVLRNQRYLRANPAILA